MNPKGLWRLLLILTLVSGGCATIVEERHFPQLSFAHLPPVKLDVARIEFKQAPLRAPGGGNIEHELPVSLRASIARWARERFQPVGKTGTALVTVEDVGFTEERLKKTTGLRGLFTTDQSERYRAVLAVSLSVTHPHRRALARAKGKRSQTVPEDSSLADREEVWFDMTEKLLKDVDRVLVEEIRRELRDYLR